VSQKRLRKNLNSDDHFERPFSFMAMKGKLQNQEKHKQDINAEDGVRLSVPVETSKPLN
jgi:hypothetical protein